MKTLTKKHKARSYGFVVRTQEIEESKRFNSLANKWHIYEQRKQELWNKNLPAIEYDNAISNLILELGL